MGTIIAYDVLRNCADCPPVDTLVPRLGSRSVTEVREQLLAKTRTRSTSPGAWRLINVYDPLDPVCGVDLKFNDYVPFRAGRWRT
jgi:hypothetical protein